MLLFLEEHLNTMKLGATKQSHMFLPMFMQLQEIIVDPMFIKYLDVEA